MNKHDERDIEKIQTISDLQSQQYVEMDSVVIAMNAEAHGTEICQSAILACHIKCLAFRLAEIHNFTNEERNYLANQITSKMTDVVVSVKTNKFSGN